MRSIVTVLLMFSSAADCAVVQAAIELGNGTEDLIELLLEKLDNVIDPKHNKSHATQELLHAVLRIAPYLTVRGNISDGTNVFSVSFNLKASDVGTAVTEFDPNQSGRPEEHTGEMIWDQRSGIFSPIVNVIEPYLLGVLNIIMQGILSSIVTHMMYEASMLGDVIFI